MMSPRRQEANGKWLKDELAAIFAYQYEDEIIEAFDSGKLFQNRGHSTVLYVIGVTDTPPKEYPRGLEVEIGHKGSPPDIDMDFESRHRDAMIAYARERYGEDRTAQIITFNTIKARSAVRDAARVLGHEFSMGDRIAKAMPPLMAGRDTPLWACFELTPKYATGYEMAQDLREMAAADPDVAEIVEVARGLEGVRRSDGQHAAAVVITPEPLLDYLPLQKRPGKPTTTQFEMDYVEKLGILKMDFLAVKNLDVIADTLALIKKNYGVDLDRSDIPFEDEKTFELLSAGSGVGLFQLESPQMRSLMRSLEPDSFDDVAALIALYRPGPLAQNMHNDYADRKNGRAMVEYMHPDAEEILGETYGLMIYQEQLMRIAQKFAGFTLAEADNLRKGVGKKIPEVVEKMRDGFVQGCINEGYGAEIGNQWFDIILPFADYGFNKSHSYGYGVVSWWTAYLKANYPAEFMAALLTHADSKKHGLYLNECAHMGLKVIAPDVNLSDTMFTAVEVDGEVLIPFGLESISHVGSLSHEIVAEREANGPYKSVVDFCERVTAKTLTTKTMEALVKSGCFQRMHASRIALVEPAKQVLKDTRKRAKDRIKGSMTLFDVEEVIPFNVPDVETSRDDVIKFEKEFLGLYLTYHPLDGYYDKLEEVASLQIQDLAEQGDRVSHRIAGIITKRERKITRKGDPMVILTVEDYTGECEVVMFKATLEDFGEFVDSDQVLCIDGKVNHRDKYVSIVVDSIRLVDSVESQALVLFVADEDLDDGMLQRLGDLVDRYPGSSDMILDTGSRVFELETKVDRARLVEILKGWFG